MARSVGGILRSAPPSPRDAPLSSEGQRTSTLRFGQHHGVEIRALTESESYANKADLRANGHR
jgi:hypothetical protein